MHASLRAFLTGIIDCAGLFPPAKLPLDPAIRNYAQYRQEPEAWMLGRFICPAARLSELRSYRDELFRSGPPFGFSVLGRGGDTVADFLAGLEADLTAISAFRQTHGDRATVEILETRLPKEVAESRRPGAVQRLLDEAAERIEAQGPPRLTPFFETSFGPAWRSDVAGVIAGLRAHNAGAGLGRSRCGAAGFKLRCGGVEAAAFPSTEQVAFAITACRDAGMALKATAGLHHPVRRFDAGVQTVMHGFLNMFGAGILAHALKLDEAQVREIVEDERAENFVFDADTFSWKALQVGRAQIEEARRSGVTTFGSCSFDEPREDLRALGLLP